MSGVQRIAPIPRGTGIRPARTTPRPGTQPPTRRDPSGVRSSSSSSGVLAVEEDTYLAIRASSGNIAAFESLVVKYQQPVFNIALGIVKNHDDAADITQTVFAKVYRRLGSYNPRYRFFSWVYRITVNESLNYFKRWRREIAVDREIGVAKRAASDTAIRHEREDHLNAALATLKPDYRVVVVLKYFIGFSYKEIAEIVSISEKTVKSRLFTARHQLRDTLTKRGFQR